MKPVIIIAVVFVLLIPIGMAFGENHIDFSTDKTLYHLEDIILISGIVDYDPEKNSVLVEIFNPEKTIEDWNNPSVNPDGTFTTSFHVGSSVFPYDGTYTVKVSYGDSVEKTIEYQKSTVKKCKDGFKLILKKSTNSQNCVKESSFEKLIQRGWGLIPAYESEDSQNSKEIVDKQKFILGKYTPIKDYPLLSELVLEGLVEKNQYTSKILVEYKGDFFYETECKKLYKEKIQLRDEADRWFESYGDKEDFPNAELNVEMFHVLDGICRFADYGN